jgi:ferredoxin-NADP reductase/fatty acid desaturase
MAAVPVANPVPSSNLDRDLRALLAIEAFAWPTLVLAIGAFGASVLAIALHARGVLPLSFALPLAVAANFACFTPLHDASHRSIAGSPRLAFVNEVVGWICALPLMAPFPAFRFVHLEHHRFTNDDERDPDTYSARGRGLGRLARWATQDLHYYAWYLARAKERPASERRAVLFGIAFVAALVGGLCLLGLGREVLLLWILPARIAIVLLALAFDFLPHWPYAARGVDAPLRATAILEHRFLTPILLSQNYHLIHHLYPGVPFYRYGEVWWALRDDLVARGALVRKIWDFRVPVDGLEGAGPYEVEVLEVVEETADARSFVLSFPEALAGRLRHRAGMFLGIEVEIAGARHRRSYSFSSSPERGERPRITVKRVPGGLVSNWLHDHVRPGDRLWIHPPGGRFVLRGGDRGPLLLVAAGSGITPILALAKAALSTTDRAVRIVYANRDRASTIFARELSALAAESGGRLVVVDHLDDREGLLDPARAAALFGDGEIGTAYLCGPAPFLAVVEAALDLRGVPEGARVRERFAATGADPGPIGPPKATSPRRLRVLLDGRSEEIPTVPGLSLLAAARAAGLALPSSCEEGYCGSCAARLVSGEVHLARREALSDLEIAEGMILPCQAHAAGEAPIVLAYDRS